MNVYKNMVLKHTFHMNDTKAIVLCSKPIRGTLNSEKDKPGYQEKEIT